MTAVDPDIDPTNREITTKLQCYHTASKGSVVPMLGGRMEFRSVCNVPDISWFSNSVRCPATPSANQDIVPDVVAQARGGRLRGAESSCSCKDCL